MRFTSQRMYQSINLWHGECICTPDAPKEAKVLEDWHTTKAGLQCFMRAVLLLMNIASCFAAV